MKIRNAIFIIATVIAVALPSCRRGAGSPDGQEITKKDSIPPLGFFTDTLYRSGYRIGYGENLALVLEKLGASKADAFTLTNICDSVFKVNRDFRAFDTLEVWYADSLRSVLRYVVYPQSFVRSTVFKCYDSLAVWKVEKKVEHARRYSDIKIETSLWDALLKDGASPDLIMLLSDIYAWTIDFFSLQPEDRFQVIYSQTVCEGVPIAVDSIFFCLYSGSGNKRAAAVYLDQKDGNKYWNEEGISLRSDKGFLKAPLKFKRVSSGFGVRIHPITGRRKMHPAVDYAAPVGTPVHTVGDGTVISAGWDKGGGGNTVIIRHDRREYVTKYLHLSKFASGIRSGVHVKQGQTIGFVGSTGRSTGPHLDFRIEKNGKPINPLKIVSSTKPEGVKINPANRPLLDSLYNAYLEQIK